MWRGMFKILTSLQESTLFPPPPPPPRAVEDHLRMRRRTRSRRIWNGVRELDDANIAPRFDVRMHVVGVSDQRFSSKKSAS